MNDKIWDEYEFCVASVPIVRSALEEYGETYAESDFPNLTKIDDEKLDALLERCWRKSYSIFTSENEIDLTELENLSLRYYPEGE